MSRLNKKIFCACLLLGACLFMTIGIFTCVLIGDRSPGAIERVFASEQELPSVVEATIPDNMFKGDVFTPPSAKVTYKGESKEGKSTLVYPSGAAKSKESYVLSEDGEYTVEYTAYFDGIPVSESRKFVASLHMYESSGVAPFYGTVAPITTRHGIVVSLKEYESFKYNRVIDFSGMTSTDPLIEMFVVPSKVGEVNARQIIYTLTDAEDPSNYITITQQAHYTFDSWVLTSTWVRASSDGQPQAGWERSKNVLHKGDKWGAPVSYSMHGTPAGGGAMCSDTFSLSLDYDSRKLYALNGQTEVVDLDDPDVFERPWNGFTSGKAYLTIVGGQYNKTTCDFVITNIAGHSLINGDAERIVDSVAPSIEVETDGGVVPDAVIGKPYAVFPAKAFDNGNMVSVVARVYRNYESDMRVEIPVKDGAFLPVIKGGYSIVYTASDKYGNVGTRVISVVAKERSAPLKINLAEDGTAGVAGEAIKLRTPFVSGAIGTSRVFVEVYKEGSSEKCVVNDYAFVPEFAGKYTVIYTAKDYVDETTERYTLEVGASAVVRIVSKPIIPKYLLAGCQYTLPTVIAYDYSSGLPVSIEATISAHGVSNNLAGRNLVANDEGELVIRYTAEANGANDVYEQVVNVVDVGYGASLSLPKYFYGEKLTATSSEDEVFLSVNSDGKVDYIKEILANFSIAFSISAQKSDNFRLKLTMRDFENPDVSLCLEFINQSGRLAYSINEKNFTLTNKAWAGEEQILISFEDATSAMTIDGKTATIKNTTSGADFTGFDSHKIYFDFAFENVSQNGSAGVKVYTINGQKFNDADSDISRPQILMLGEVGREYHPGEIVSLRRAIASDVLDPSVVCLMSVKGPDGEEIWSTDGRRLINVSPSRVYDVKLTKYGQYNITFILKDSSGNQRPVSYAINVTDAVPPELKFGVSVPSVAKVGEEVSIPACTASDNRDACVTVYVTLNTPDGQVIKLYETERDNKGNVVLNENGMPKIMYYSAFTAKKVGTYKLTYYATDVSGNVTLRSFTIKIY